MLGLIWHLDFGFHLCLFVVSICVYSWLFVVIRGFNLCLFVVTRGFNLC